MFLALALMLCLTMTAGSPPIAYGESIPKETRDTAIFQNFVDPQNDPLGGDNGLPQSAAVDEVVPQKYGAYAVLLDTDGNALDGTIEYIAYFEGKYYMYASSHSYGSFDNAGGSLISAVMDTEPASMHRYSGVTIYESDDLMNWTLKDRWIPVDADGRVKACRKVRVLYSPVTEKYVMWAPDRGSAQVDPDPMILGVADHPWGPFSDIQRPGIDPAVDFEGNGDNRILSHDFDVCVDPNHPENAYIVQCKGANLNLYKLNPEMNTLIDRITIPTVKDGDGTTFGGGIGLSYHDGYWYITGSAGCGDCTNTPLHYISCRDGDQGPMNKEGWGNPVTKQTLADYEAISPVVIHEDSGYSQSHGAMTLPAADGNVYAFIPFTHYRNSPTGSGDVLIKGSTGSSGSGDNNHGICGTLWYPLEYGENGTILPIDFKSTETFPLVQTVETTVPNLYQAYLGIIGETSIAKDAEKTEFLSLHDIHADYVPNGSGVQQSFYSSEPDIQSITVAVFQWTPDSTVGGLRGEPRKPAQEPMVNAPLHVSLSTPNGTAYAWDVSPYRILWSAQKIQLNLKDAVTEACEANADGRYALTLTTAATNGGYGVAVGQKSGNVLTAKDSMFSRTGSDAKDFPEAAMHFTLERTLCEAPVIVQQPRSVVVSAEGGHEAGFTVKAEGVGIGYSWERLNEETGMFEKYKPTSESYDDEAYGPSLRLGFTAAYGDAYGQIRKSDAGTYRVRVFNGVGEVYSDEATLTVVDGPVVTGVKITSGVFEIEKGASVPLTAAVRGRGADIPQGIVWSVEGATAKDTVISGDGILTVGGDETAHTLIVRAISVCENVSYPGHETDSMNITVK